MYLSIQFDVYFVFLIFFFQYIGQRSERGQSAMHAYDKNTSVIFYSQVSLNGIGCWNTKFPLNPSNLHLIAQDNTTMIYPSDINVRDENQIIQFMILFQILLSIFVVLVLLQIDSDGFIWVMTNNLPVYSYASIDPNQFNYRIWKAPVERAIKGTPCDRMQGTTHV